VSFIPFADGSLARDPVPRLRRLALLRLLAPVGAVILIAVAAWRVPGLSTGPPILTVGVLAALDLVLVGYLRTPNAAHLSEQTAGILVQAQIVVDLVGLTVLLYFTGAAENPFYPFYIFPVIVGAALLARPLAFVYAGLATVLYAGLLFAEWQGWVPQHHSAGFLELLLPQRGGYLLAQWMALAATCFLTAEATVVLVSALRAGAQELAESNWRTESRAAELRQLNEQLRAANDEYRHQREHLDAAYLELERAYDRLQVRSSQLSELNEQLRAANAECKLRREELGDLNNRLQETLVRLETRNERMRDLTEQLRDANEECRSRRDELEKLNTELARANTKLRELEDIRAQFTLLVTHELRAPVAAIQSYLKLILEGYVPEAKMRETLEKAERRAMDQLALIADLLELGRIGSADARGQVQPLQVEQALREQVELLGAAARERGIRIQLDIEPDLPAVLANPDQIKSLWNNLISNAIKYNRDGGRVEMSLKHTGNRLTASVCDTGIGIPPDAMPRLFSEFFRADNAKAYSRSGTGLGLSIVKEIVERAGGEITAESELDKGTTFRFWLPARAEPHTSPAPVAAEQPATAPPVGS
jgi:K+-sensing histidine kinase KdpD